MSVLVFQLRGDFAAWGDIAVGEQRNILPFPTKSAVVGLIAAALGITRQEEEKQSALVNAIKYGVKVFHSEKNLSGYDNTFNNKPAYSGGYMRDYHTVQAPSEPDIRLFAKKHGRRPASRYDEIQAMKLGKSEGTILSYREYHLDSYYVVGLTLIKPLFVSMEEIQMALETPRFHLYLGRKACPLGWPLSPQVLEVSDIKAAIEKADFKLEDSSLNAERYYGIPNKDRDSRFYMETDSGQPKNSGSRLEEYRTLPRSRARWQFDTQWMEVSA